MSRLIFVCVGLFACVMHAFAQLPPPGGGQPPAGYSVLNGDWWYKFEYEGTTVVKNWATINGVDTAVVTTTAWPPLIELGASNGTQNYHEASKREEGEVTLKVKWRHGQDPAPPSVLRIAVSSNANAYTTSIAYDVELSSGIGLPVRDIGIGRQWDTPGTVLRKIPIDASGEGEFTCTQKAYITARSPWSVCDTAVPHLTVSVDTRDVHITGINTVWPKVKGGTVYWYDDVFPLPQDQYEWFDHYKETRNFRWFTDLGKPAPLSFPSDVTDESEWHIGLVADYSVIAGPNINLEMVKPIFTGSFSGFVVAPNEGDPYSWSARMGLADMIGTRDGNYNSATASEALGHDGTYLRPITVKETVPVGPSFAHTHPRDSTKTDTVSWKWQWMNDGLQAESRRKIILHSNAEVDGQESDEWDDVRIEKGYQLTKFTYSHPGGPQIAGWVTRSVQFANISDPPTLLSYINVLGPIFSAGGPFGAIVMAAGGIQAASVAIAFASVEAVGALLDLIPQDSKTWEIGRGTYATNQCDSLVTPPLMVDTDQDGYVDALVETANYEDPDLLIALKASLAGPLTPIQTYYWRMKHRLIHKLKYQVYDEWGLAGFKGKSMRDYRTERPISDSFFHMEFKESPKPNRRVLICNSRSFPR